MRKWRILPGERAELFSPIGLRLIDEITGGAPVGPITAELDIQDGVKWRETGIKAVRTPGGVVAYPGLGREADVNASSHHYRVRITAEFYRPLYLATGDAIEFDAPPFNDTNPPVPVTKLPLDVKLAPAPNYPFESWVPVLRGVVVDQATLEPVPDVQVMVTNVEHVLTDDKGLFALPMRFTAMNPTVPVPIDALDQRNARTGSINVTLPADLGRSQTIPIS